MFDEELLDESIQVKECQALLHFVENFAPEKTRITVLVDSQPVIGAFKNKFSKNQKVNSMLRQIFAVLARKGSMLELIWIPTAEMAEVGADNLTRDYISAFRDLKSLSVHGADRLLRFVQLGEEAIDLFASAADNPFGLKYCHTAWDVDDKLAMGCDAFEFLETICQDSLEMTVYAYDWGCYSWVNFFLPACSCGQ